MEYLACSIFWEITLPCLRSVPLLFLVCMYYGICNDPWMVRYTSQVLLLVTRMPYYLSYCGSILLSLLVIEVFGCNQAPHRYVCMTIGGDVLLIVGVYLDLLLLAGSLFPTVEGGSLYIHFIVPL